MIHNIGFSGKEVLGLFFTRMNLIIRNIALPRNDWLSDMCFNFLKYLKAPMRNVIKCCHVYIKAAHSCMLNDGGLQQSSWRHTSYAYGVIKSNEIPRVMHWIDFESELTEMTHKMTTFRFPITLP